MSLKLLYIMLNGHQLAIFLVPNYGPPKHHHAVFFWATKVWPRCPVWSWKVWMPSWNPVAKQTWQAGKSTITGSFNGNIIKLYQTTLLLFNSSPWYRWPIEIDGLPINSMVIFHGSLLNNQMVNGGFYWMVAVSLEPGTSSSQGHTSTRLARGSLHLWQLGSPKIGWQSVEKTWILNIFYGKMESSPFCMGKKNIFLWEKPWEKKHHFWDGGNRWLHMLWDQGRWRKGKAGNSVVVQVVYRFFGHWKIRKFISIYQ